jgi:hypothetical protein
VFDQYTACLSAPLLSYSDALTQTVYDSIKVIKMGDLCTKQTMRIANVHVHEGVKLVRHAPSAASIAAHR